MKGILGLAIRAGKVSFGMDSVKSSIRSSKAHLVLISNTASDRSKKDIGSTCAHYKIELITGDFGDVFVELTGRDAMKVLSINDKNFAKGIKAKHSVIID